MPIIFSGGGGTLSEAASGSQNLVSYTGSTTYTPSSGTKHITVHCIAGGGGSGSGDELTGEEESDHRPFGGAGGGGYVIGHYNITGQFSGSVLVGGGGAGAQASSHQFRAGGGGGNSAFQPSGSYNGNGQIVANGGGGAHGTGNAGGGGASGGLNFSGQEGEPVHGTSGEHGTGEAGVGGMSGHGGVNYGRGAGGITSSTATNGNAGQSGYVYIIEYRA
jgi:hypothetical protein